MAVTIIKLNGETILDLISINISEEVLEFKTFVNNQGEIKKELFINILKNINSLLLI